MSNQMTTEEIMTAYDALLREEIETIKKKDDQIQKRAEERQEAISRKEKIEEIKKKILEKRKLMKEKTEVDNKVKKTLKEHGGEGPEDEEEEEEVEVEEDIEVEEDEEVEVEEDEEVEVEEDEEVKESRQAIYRKIRERKVNDILKKIKERKEKAESIKKPIEEKKEVKVGVLLEAVQGDKKRRFSVYREEKDHFYLKELGTGKTFRIAKEKIELTN